MGKRGRGPGEPRGFFRAGEARDKRPAHVFGCGVLFVPRSWRSSCGVLAYRGRMPDQETSSVQLTVQQAAQHAAVSPKTIRRWLSSGRLAACFDGQAYAIDQADLERAAASGRPLDVQPPAGRTNGHVQSMSIVQELLDRLERQAGEITALRIERDQLAVRLLALQAPKSDSPVVAPERDSEGLAVELPREPSEPSQAIRRPWWLRWLPA